MSDPSYSDDMMRDILRRCRTVAVVGASNNPARPSYQVMQFLQQQGCRCIPVNPGLAGQVLLGETVHADLSAVPLPVDMVDIFRNSDAAAAITDQAIAIGAKVVWMQLEVRHDAAARRAEAAGVQVVMNRCPKIEWQRLGLESLSFQ